MAGQPITQGRIEILEEIGEEEIFRRYVELGAISRVCAQLWEGTANGVDTRPFHKWIDKDEDRKTRWQEVKKMRGHMEFDLILEKAEKATAKNVRVNRLQIDAHKYRAERLNRDDYGQQTNQGVTINIGSEWLQSLREANTHDQIPEADHKLIEATTEDDNT